MNTDDQTEPTWLVGTTSETLGTGMFVGSNRKKEFIPDLTYAECIQLGQSFAVFRWIPHSIISYEKLIGSA